MPTGELSEATQARSPLGNNGPKVESPLVSLALPLLAVLPAPPNEITAFEGAGVAEALAPFTEAADATGLG